MNFDTKPDILEARDFGPGGHAISASAGTGKTYTLERLVFDRVVEGEASIDDILVVTFTRRATAEMKERIRSLFQKCLAKWEQYDDTDEEEPPREGGWSIDEDAARRARDALNDFDEATISTIHGFCRELLAEYRVASRGRFDVEFVDRKELFEECFYDVLRDTLAVDSEHNEHHDWLELYLEGKGDVDDLADQLGTLCDRNPDAIVPSREDLELPVGGEPPEDEALPDDKKLRQGRIQTACWHLFLEPVEARIEEKKQLEGLQTYDGLLETVESELGDNEAFTRTLREAYEVVLVDEAQDVDPVQWEILREAFLESPDSYEHELILIGDEKQAIYGFRGADVETYRNARDELEGETGGAGLDTNYRATAELIEAYDTIFEGGFLPEEYDYEGVDSPEGEARTERALEGTAIGGDEPEPIEVLHLEPDEKVNKGKAESAFVEKTAERIDEVLGSKEAASSTYHVEPENENKRPVEPGDIYVLTRTNSEAEAVGDALREHGILFSYFKKPGLFESDEALDVLRLLRAIARPSDRSRRRKAMLTPFFNLRLDELAAWEETEDGWSPRKRLEQWQKLAERRSFPELFEKILARSGVVRRRLLSSSDERSLTNYRHLFEWLFEQAASTKLGLEQLADALQRCRQDGAESTGPDEDDADTQRQETDRSTVRISTIHKSKGLESEIVFICGGFGKREEKNWRRDVKTFRRPRTDEEEHYSSKTVSFHYRLMNEDDGELPAQDDHPFKEYISREIRRLYYVAITRAKSKVFLPYIRPQKGDTITSSLKKSQIRYLWDRLEDIPFDQTPGFEVHSFTLDDVDIAPTPPEIVESVEIDDGDEDWSVEEVVSASPPSPVDFREEAEDLEELHELVQRHNESYSSLASHGGSRGGPIEEPHEHPLPSGTDAGEVIHEVLEYVDYTTADGLRDWEAWLEQSSGHAEGETVRDLVVDRLEEHGLDQKADEEADGDDERYEYLPYTAQRLMEALQTPLEPEDGPDLPSLSTVERERTAREVGFAVDTWHRALVPESKVDGPVRDDYLNGEIDLIFEDDGGAFYFADWKSDSKIGRPDGDEDEALGPFEAERLAHHVREEYEEQIAVYTAAMVRMLGIENEDEYESTFGGLFYLFVRGMTDDHEGAGYHFERPTWEDVVALHEGLARRPPRDVVGD